MTAIASSSGWASLKDLAGGGPAHRRDRRGEAPRLPSRAPWLTGQHRCQAGPPCPDPSGRMLPVLPGRSYRTGAGVGAPTHLLRLWVRPHFHPPPTPNVFRETFWGRWWRCSKLRFTYTQTGRHLPTVKTPARGRGSPSSACASLQSYFRSQLYAPMRIELPINPATALQSD
jgi:hypothetical protein